MFKNNKFLIIKRLTSVFFVLFLIFSIISCQRNAEAAEDDLPQEEFSMIRLEITDTENPATSSFYAYYVGTAAAPVIPLTDGKSYEVTVTFWNGNDDVTQSIKDAKNEHFIIFDFPKSTINLTREDGEDSTGNLGKIGLKTKWDVVKVIDSQSPLLKLTLIHEPVSTDENQNGTSWGSAVGGETDAEATFTLSN